MNQMKRQSNILIIEDDVHINNIIYDALLQENYMCTQAFSGSEGKLLVAHQRFDLIILDLMLPGLSGEAFMQYVRSELECSTPVIVLSAKDQLDHKLHLFELGVVDYMTKPFELKELLARINVHIEKHLNIEPIHQYIHKNLTLDCVAQTVQINEIELTLTRQEYKIVEVLIKNPLRMFTKQDLYTLAWDDQYIGEDKTLTVHISNIRNKIKKYDEHPYIDTVWGIGFKLSRS